MSIVPVIPEGYSRYDARFPGKSTNDYREMHTWCERQFGDPEYTTGFSPDGLRLVKRANSNGWFVMSWGIFYFNDPKKAMLFKLTWMGQ